MNTSDEPLRCEQQIRDTLHTLRHSPHHLRHMTGDDSTDREKWASVFAWMNEVEWLVIGIGAAIDGLAQACNVRVDPGLFLRGQSPRDEP